MKPTVIIFTNTYKPVLGGVQKVCSEIAELNKDYNVVIFTNKFPVNLKFYEKINEVPIYRFFLGNFYNEIDCVKSLLIRTLTIINFPIVMFRLILLFKKFKTTVINIHFPRNQIKYVLFLDKFLKLKIITSFHGHDVLQWNENKINSLYSDQKEILHKSFSITACSNYLSYEVSKKFKLKKGKVSVLYNGISAEKLMNNKITSNYFFAYGRLEYHKGFDLLVEAFSKSTQIKEYELIIAGSGSYKAQLENLISKLKLEKNIKLIGRINPKEVNQYCSNARSIIIPSRREPFGIVVLEAIRSLTPIIASNVGGIPEIFHNDFGLLVEPNVESIRIAIDNIVKQPKRLDIKKVENHLEKFSNKSMVNAYNRLYESL